MICPECKGHGEIRQPTPAPGEGDHFTIMRCPMCRGIRSILSPYELMERFDALEALIKKRTPQYQPATPRGYAPRKLKRP